MKATALLRGLRESSLISSYFKTETVIGMGLSSVVFPGDSTNEIAAPLTATSTLPPRGTQEEKTDSIAKVPLPGISIDS